MTAVVKSGSDALVDYPPDSAPGTYALLLRLSAPAALVVGSLGRIRFDSPFYLYVGSAFGAGGLRGRLKHHLSRAERAHWHIDYLRRVAEVLGVWYTRDTVRLECLWANAVSTLPDGVLVPRFGSSDCRCDSHLLAVQRIPSLSAFRRRLEASGTNCVSIRQLRVARPFSARQGACN